MYSVINIILIILSYQCMTTKCFSETVAEDNPIQPDITQLKGCLLKEINTYGVHMPIPFGINLTEPYIIYPDRFGNFYFEHGSSFLMSCVDNYFISPRKVNSFIKEVFIRCLNGSLIYEGKKYDFDNFICHRTPRSRLIVTKTSCRGDPIKSIYKILDVGFHTSHGFISLYKVCFNMVNRTNLYSWTYMKAPFYKYRQITDKYTRYTYTGNFGRTDIVQSYLNQTSVLEEILGSKSKATIFVKKTEGRRYLVPCHLTAKKFFFYVFENDATYYYENTAPQWIEFNRYGWKELDVVIRKNLVRDNRDHVIITGTYLVSKFKDVNGTEREFYLSLPNRLGVPQYFWKMYYDVETKSGTVFIGLNNPYMKIDPDIFFCETTKCPGHLSRKNAKKDLVFCCTKEAFEKVYGNLPKKLFQRYI